MALLLALSVTLPMIVITAAVSGTQEQLAREVAEGTGPILVVDDDESILDFVEMVLTDEGFDVILHPKPFDVDDLVEVVRTCTRT